MPEPSRNLAPKKRRFLLAYESCCQVREAAERAGIDRRTHYQWLKDDPEYAVAFEAARQSAGDVLEDEAFRRAHDGVDEPVVHAGQLTYLPVLDAAGKPLLDADGKPVLSQTPLAIRKYSDVLLIFLLKGSKPEKYRERYEDRIQLEVSGSLSIAEILRNRRRKRLEDGSPTAETPE